MEDRLLKKTVYSLTANDCFLYGSFVVEDAHHTLYQSLRKSENTSRRVVGLTHAQFSSGRHLRGGARLVRLPDDMDGQWEFRLSKPLRGLCTRFCTTPECERDSQSAVARVVLFYAFSVETADERRDYMYAKFEDSGYLDPRHIVSAFSTYALGVQRTSVFWPSRRETSPPGVVGDTFYDAHVRIGNEFFVEEGDAVKMVL